MTPTRQSTRSSLEAVLLQHRISSQMTVVARINVSPGQGPLVSVSPASCSFFGPGAGGGEVGERVDKQYRNQDSPAMTYCSFPNRSSHFVQA